MKILKERIHALTKRIDNISVVPEMPNLNIVKTPREADKLCKAGGIFQDQPIVCVNCCQLPKITITTLKQQIYITNVYFIEISP